MTDSGIKGGSEFIGLVLGAGKGLDMGLPLPYLRALRDWFVNATDEDVNKVASEWDKLALKFKH